MVNKIINPEKLKKILSEKDYWDKGLIASLWWQFKYDEEEPSSSFPVFVELNDKGFFINAFLIFDWSVEFAISDDCIACYTEKGLYVFFDNLIQTGTKDGLRADIALDISKDLVAYALFEHGKYLINRLSEELPYWNKEIKCFVKKTTNTLLVNETGLYLNGIQKIAWEDYLSYELYPNVLQLMHREVLIYWGNENSRFAPLPEHLIDFKKNVIICCGEEIYLEDPNKSVLESIEKALKCNLKEQEISKGENYISTRITCSSLNMELDVVNPKFQTAVCIKNGFFSRASCKIVPTPQQSTNELGLLLCVRFYEITDRGVLFLDKLEAKEYNAFNEKNSLMHRNFKRIDIFRHFILQTADLVLTNKLGCGIKYGKVYQYNLNLGLDVDTASKMILQYIQKAYHVENFDPYRFEFQMETVESFEYESKINKANNKSRILKYVGIVFFVLFIIFFINEIFSSDTFSIFSYLGLSCFVLMLFRMCKKGGL